MFFLKFNKFKLLEGYKILKKNRFKNILHVRSKIEDNFKIKKNLFLFNLLIKNIEFEDFSKNIKSNFIYEKLDYNFNKEVLLNLSGKKYCLNSPHEITSILKEENYKTSYFNNFFWKFVLIFRLIKHYLKIIFKIKNQCLAAYVKNSKHQGQCIYIRNQDRLSSKFWKSNNNSNKNNIFWLLKKTNADQVFLENTDDCNIFFNNKNISINSLNIFKFKNLFEFIKLLFLLNYKFIICFILIFSPYWYFAFNFFKIIEHDSFQINLHESDTKKIKYFFDNNYMFDQPLWILSKNIKKKNVYVYFVSSNFELIYLSDQDQIPYSGYKSLNWNNFIVWDNRQKEIIQKNINKKFANFEIMDPIPNFPIISNSAQEKNKNFSKEKKNILLFDVQPYRLGRFIYLGMPNEYYTFLNIQKFYSDIISETDHSKYKLFFKRKRETKNIDKKYIIFLENLKSEKIIEEIHHDQNIFEFFSNDITTKVISIPFTGPTYIANHFNIKSCFYDPTGDVSNNYSWNLKTINKKNILSNFINDK